jgi:hypothetical protein
MSESQMTGVMMLRITSAMKKKRSAMEFCVRKKIPQNIFQVDEAFLIENSGNPYKVIE